KYYGFFFQAEDGIRDRNVTGVQTCALPISGAYGGEMKQVVLSAKVMDSNGTVLELSKDELELGYRTSTIGRNGYIALSCVIELQPGDPDCIRSTMEEMNAKRRQDRKSTRLNSSHV